MLRVSRTLGSFTDKVTTLNPITTHKAFVFLRFLIHKSWLWLGLSRIIRLHTRCNENGAVTHGSRNHNPAWQYHAIIHHASRIDGFASNLSAWKAGHVVFFFLSKFVFYFAISRGTPAMFCRIMVGEQLSRLTPGRPKEPKWKIICGFTGVSWEHGAKYLSTPGRFP